MASISRRSTGFQVEIRRRGFPKASKCFATRTDAKAWARMVESQIERNAFLDRKESQRTILAALLTRYRDAVTLPSEVMPQSATGSIGSF